MEPQHETPADLDYEAPTIECADDIEGLLGPKTS